LLVREPFGSRQATASAEDMFGMYGIVVLWAVLVPTLVLVLALPNRGSAPAVVERWVSRWPAWLRGTPDGTPVPTAPPICTNPGLAARRSRTTQSSRHRRRAKCDAATARLTIRRQSLDSDG
jgi:hypothetical protein